MCIIFCLLCFIHWYFTQEDVDRNVERSYPVVMFVTWIAILLIMTVSVLNVVSRNVYEAIAAKVCLFWLRLGRYWILASNWYRYRSYNFGYDLDIFCISWIPADITEKTTCGRVGEMVAIIHQCCSFLIAFASCHYNDIQKKVSHLIAFSASDFSYLQSLSYDRCPIILVYNTLAYIQLIYQRIKIAYPNYKIALVPSYFSLWQQLESLNDYGQISPWHSSAVVV